MTARAQSRLVLELLEDREAYGMELVRRSGGALRREGVYVLLARMTRAGLVEGRLVDAPPGAAGGARRTYRATDLGRRVLAAARAWDAVLGALVTGPHLPRGPTD